MSQAIPTLRRISHSIVSRIAILAFTLPVYDGCVQTTKTSHWSAAMYVTAIG